MSQVNQYKSGRCAEWFCLSLNIYIIYIYYVLSPMSYFYDSENPKQENTVAEPEAVLKMFDSSADQNKKLCGRFLLSRVCT